MPSSSMVLLLKTNILLSLVIKICLKVGKYTENMQNGKKRKGCLRALSFIPYGSNV